MSPPQVEPHEVVIVQDNLGEYSFYNGNASGKGTAFFLPPHSQLVSMMWSSGSDGTSASDAGAKAAVTKIDLRAQYAFFQYTVRTSDNVELLLVRLHPRHSTELGSPLPPFPLRNACASERHHLLASH